MRQVALFLALCLLALLAGCAARAVNDPNYKVKRLLWQIERGPGC
jgi:outer membrane biogenesis lipoprotein LolB